MNDILNTMEEQFKINKNQTTSYILSSIGWLRTDLTLHVRHSSVVSPNVFPTRSRASSLLSLSVPTCSRRDQERHLSLRCQSQRVPDEIKSVTSTSSVSPEVFPTRSRASPLPPLSVPTCSRRDQERHLYLFCQSWRVPDEIKSVTFPPVVSPNVYPTRSRASATHSEDIRLSLVGSCWRARLNLNRNKHQVLEKSGLSLLYNIYI